MEKDEGSRHPLGPQERLVTRRGVVLCSLPGPHLMGPGYGAKSLGKGLTLGPAASFHYSGCPGGPGRVVWPLVPPLRSPEPHQ